MGGKLRLMYIVIWCGWLEVKKMDISGWGMEGSGLEGQAWGEKGRDIGGYVNNRLTLVHKMAVWYIIYTIKKKATYWSYSLAF